MTTEPTIVEFEVLQALLDDPTTTEADLAPYFEPDLFSGHLDLRDDVQVVGLEDAEYVTKGLRSVAFRAFLKVMNRTVHEWRERHYEQTIERHPELTRLIVEGDSWCVNPRVKDLVNQLGYGDSPRFAVYSIGGAGDKLETVWRQHSYIDAARRQGASTILLSAGGNDVLGNDLPPFLRDHTDGEGVQRFLNANFDRKMHHLRTLLDTMASELGRELPDATMYVHGYDYVRPGTDDPDRARFEHEGTWLGRHFSDRGITEPVDRDGLARHIMDEFNDGVLAPISEKHTNLVYVDTRGSVGTHEWFDEIHPNGSGFSAVAARITAAIEARL